VACAVPCTASRRPEGQHRRGGELHTTAGAKALEQIWAERDAFWCGACAKAGAVVLGKAALRVGQLHVEPSPRIQLGGRQVRNPYGAFDVSGSSSGSAVAVAAGFATVAVGTETWGSLIAPASQNSVVAIKPSAGLVSRDGIIPVIASQDTAGPVARSVTDAAILLDVLVGEDVSDPATRSAPREEGSYQRALDAGGLTGRRVGAVRLRGDYGDREILAASLRALEQCGAEVVEPRRSRLST
jgi:amidase